MILATVVFWELHPIFGVSLWFWFVHGGDAFCGWWRPDDEAAAAEAAEVGGAPAAAAAGCSCGGATGGLVRLGFWYLKRHSCSRKGGCGSCESEINYLAAPLNFRDSMEPRSKSSVDEDEGCCCCCWDAAFVSDAVATEEEAEDDEAAGCCCCCCCCCEPGGDVLLLLPPPPFAGTIPSSLANSEGR